MKRLLLFLLIGSASAALADAAAPVYRWKATAGGIPAPESTTNVAAAAVYLFDAKTLSPSNLVANLRKGAALSEQPYVIGKVLADGVLPTTDDFSYAGEPAGADWSAYMALECAAGGRRYAYVTETVDVMGVAFGFTAISFGAQGDWYALSPQPGVISPGSGTSECEIAAADAEAATNLVQIVSPDESVVSSADYAKYFRMVATPLSEGRYLVRAELDAEAIELDKSTGDLAANLAALAAAGGTTVTVEVTSKAGLTYRILSATSPAGPYEKGDAVPASGAKTPVGAKVPEGGRGFFKVGAGVK